MVAGTLTPAARHPGRYPGLSGMAALLAVLMLSLAGCVDPDASKGDYIDVDVGGKSFRLELALTDEKRFIGLSGRNDIPENTGMLFAFRSAAELNFVMRDCPVPIDIIYLDPSGRVTAFHHMVPEPPRSDAEKVLEEPYPGAPAWTHTNKEYEKRLEQYPSRFPAQFVIELKGDTLKKYPVKVGQKIKLDVEGLKKRAQ